MPTRLDDIVRRPPVLLVLWAACVASVAWSARHFWIPLDDGTLAQSAERVLHGQLPQVDFDDPYSGLGAMLGALAFRGFGVSLPALRVPLVAAFGAWLPAVWMIARRFVAPTAAALVTLLAATASVPAYPAAMPTWYGLFLATWSVLLLIRYLEDGGRGWLAAAGALAGVSILFKVVGLYTLAAAFLTLAWHHADGSRGHRVITVLGTGAFLVLLGRMVLPGGSATVPYLFFLPSLALCGALARRAWSAGRGYVGRARAPSGRTGVARAGGVAPLLLDGTVLVAGAVLPITLFLLPYAAAGGVVAWLDGVFLLPFRRLTSAASGPGNWNAVVPGMVAVALLAGVTRVRRVSPGRLAVTLAALLALALALDDAAGGAVLAALWYAVRGWVPALTVWGAFRVRDARGWAVVAATGLWSLVQFPYTAPAYFFYVAPLAVLATVAVVVSTGGEAPAPEVSSSRIPAGPVLALFAGVFLFLAAGYAAGVVGAGSTPLDLDRAGGLRVPTEQARLYRDLVETVHDHADDGGLWAGPDAPEVYFLAGMPNTTRTIYEFLSAGTDAPRVQPDENPSIQVVVINTRPLFSRPLAGPLLQRLETAFPGSRTVGPFVVRWREP